MAPSKSRKGLMGVHFAAVHEKNTWRKHSSHASVEAATTGNDGAENLLRNLKRVRDKRAKYGAVYAVFVWDDTMLEATALRLIPGSSSDIERTPVAVKLLRTFKAKDRPSLSQIDDWFAPPAPAFGMWHPDELPRSGTYPEGTARQVLVNAYERNAAARQACINHYGPICKACDLDFEDRYGPIGIGFIHVHHEVPIATIGVDYKVDPVRDLKPLCPNCHAMLHRHEPPISVAKLRTMLRRRG